MLVYLKESNSLAHEETFQIMYFYHKRLSYLINRGERVLKQ